MGWQNSAFVETDHYILQKYVIGANAETLAYDLIIYAFQNLSLNCQFNDIFQNIVTAYFEPYSPYDEGWSLNVHFVDPSEY